MIENRAMKPRLIRHIAHVKYYASLTKNQESIYNDDEDNPFNSKVKKTNLLAKKLFGKAKGLGQVIKNKIEKKREKRIVEEFEQRQK